jgi:RAB6A-GEF complex partner protein 1
VEYAPDVAVYQSPPLAASARGKFLAGPGEGLPLQSIDLRFEGVILVEGNLLW